MVETHRHTHRYDAKDHLEAERALNQPDMLQPFEQTQDDEVQRKRKQYGARDVVRPIARQHMARKLSRIVARAEHIAGEREDKNDKSGEGNVRHEFVRGETFMWLGWSAVTIESNPSHSLTDACTVP